MTFDYWWANDDTAHKAKHDGDEAAARAAWNAALSLAAIKARLAQVETGHDAYEEIMALRSL